MRAIIEFMREPVSIPTWVATVLTVSTGVMVTESIISWF